MRVNFLDLKSQYLSIKDEIDEAIQNVLINTAFTAGPYVKSFEDNSIPAVNAGSVEITDGEVVELNIGDGLGICGAVPAERSARWRQVPASAQGV